MASGHPVDPERLKALVERSRKRSDEVHGGWAGIRVSLLARGLSEGLTSQDLARAMKRLERLERAS